MGYLNTPEDKCSFYLNIVYPIKNEGGNISFPPGAADLILEAFFKAPEKMKGQGKALAQLYPMSSKNQNVDSGLNTSVGLWASAAEQTAFITDFAQEYPYPVDAAMLFEPILSKKFLTPVFLSAIYGRPDVFTKPFRVQSLDTISPKALPNFVTLLQEDIENLPHFNPFDILNPDIPKPKIANFTPIMELLFNVYRYTKNNENYHLFTEALPGYEEMIKNMKFVIFSYALILCRLHKEIVEGGGNPCLEDVSRLSNRLLGDDKGMYTVLILFCLSKDYNDAGLIPSKIEMLKKIMKMEHRNQDDFIKVHTELYDLFEQGNDTTKEIITRYGILKDK